MFLCHNEQACVLSQLCKIGGGGAQGVTIWQKALCKTPRITCCPHRPALQPLPWRRVSLVSLVTVTDATAGTGWAPSPFTVIFPHYYRMLWEHLGNYPNSLRGRTLCPHAREVHTQNIQPELEVLASFVISGSLSAR